MQNFRHLVATRQRSNSMPTFAPPPFLRTGSQQIVPRTTTQVSEGLSPRGLKQVNQYIFGDDLGSGAFSKVKLCTSTEDELEYAVKMMNKSILARRRFGLGQTSALDSVKREIAILKKLNHENVVRLYEIIDDPSSEKLYLVMEHMPGGALMSERSTNAPLPEDTVWKYMRDIVSGLEYLHKQKVLHRDIKPSNLLLGADGRVKISDFGVSQLFDGDDDSLTRTAGSPAYTAPEICNQSTSSFSGRAADIWALGVSMHMLLFGRLPFIADSVPDLYHAILEQSIDISSLNVSPLLQNLLEQLLDKNPETRITLPQLRNHDWLTKSGTRPLPVLLTVPIDVNEHEVNSAFTTVNQLMLLIKMKTRMGKIAEQARTRVRSRSICSTDSMTSVETATSECEYRESL
eukprot:TRINITY_DN4816_c0_g1_i2.p1 TRINITY_DN4816_c0_g1~~TRINITY_DN4816_c0_g1_i2.p1  ORF type:complete len:403 (+),score=70.18 TRINITY_DN4816_c0_g1_i2:108-1316(+)